MIIATITSSWSRTQVISQLHSLEKHGTNREVVRFVQPAHHVGLLLWAEVGSLGLLLLLLFILYKIFFCFAEQNHWLLLILARHHKSGIILLEHFFLCSILTPNAVWDHYLISQQVGLLLLALAISVKS
jgi:hypothetical protein